MFFESLRINYKLYDLNEFMAQKNLIIVKIKELKYHLIL